jgi:hypothetical protein
MLTMRQLCLAAEPGPTGLRRCIAGAQRRRLSRILWSANLGPRGVIIAATYVKTVSALIPRLWIGVPPRRVWQDLQAPCVCRGKWTLTPLGPFFHPFPVRGNVSQALAIVR